MSKITLSINTSVREEIQVSLIADGKKTELTKNGKEIKGQVTLPLIDEILKKNNLIVQDLDEIEIFEGPGSFTGLRVGTAIANALGWSLQKPVNGKRTIILPKYSE